ncbi:MAG: PEP-CTERM sorting domain-containing protein [Opitutaceae bacterium]|nr:PEP-CTERM sorting domain-containing protein [Opitutaceae bacterium]
MKPKKAKTAALAALLILSPFFAAAVVQGQTNLVINGDFESQALAPWSASHYSQTTPTNSSVVNTTSLDEDGYALTINRVDESNNRNPPGVAQTFKIDAGGVSSLQVSFNYVGISGTTTKVLFRIYAGTSYYGTYTASAYSYYSAADSGWETASFFDRNDWNKSGWGSDASGSTNYNNLAANTVVLSASSQTGLYELSLPVLAGYDTYTIEFFNPVRNSTIAIDNIVVTATAAIPEPATVSLIAGLLVVPVAGWITIRRRKLPV